MIMSLKQMKIKFKPRIKLNNNIHTYLLLIDPIMTTTRYPENKKNIC